MKNKPAFIVALAAMFAVMAWIEVNMYQKTRFTPPESSVSKYVDVTTLRLVNKGFSDTETPFTRLPASLHDSVSDLVWNRQQCSSGIAVRFATDSRRVGVRYDLLMNNHMSHMTGTAMRGADLYVFGADSVWHYLNCSRPDIKEGTERTVEFTYASGLDAEMKEFILYLPLYDGVTNMHLIVEKDAAVTSGSPDLIDGSGKVVAYGTSVMQGACASRPSLMATNVLGRELNCEVVNLGLNGACKMEPVMARAMAAIPEAVCYIIDPVANLRIDEIEERTYVFVSLLRSLRPDASVIMVEGLINSCADFERYKMVRNIKKYNAFRNSYKRLRAERPDGIYYVQSEGLYGKGDMLTVDNTHPTDFGFRNYAERLIPLVRPLLK